MSKIISKGTSSALLYFYHYIVFFVASLTLYFWGNFFSMISTLMVLVFVIDAKTMKYELTDTTLHISGSLWDRESTIVKLCDVKGFCVIDRQPWSFFSLGSVLVIVDMNAESHPCIKCIKDPLKLAKVIKNYALRNKAQIHPDYNV